MPTVITCAALSARGFGSGGNSGRYWASTFTQASSSADVYAYSNVIGVGNYYYFAGYTNTPSNYIGTIVKTNALGIVQWQRKLNLASELVAIFSVFVDASSNVYITGLSNGASFGSATNRAFFAKYDSSGSLQWQRTLFDTGTGNRNYGISVDGSGNVFGVGSVSGGTLIAKYNSSGTIQWQRKLASGSGFRAIGLDSSSNVYCVGGGGVVGIAKYDTSGTIQWQRSATESTFQLNGLGSFTDTSGNTYISGVRYATSPTLAQTRGAFLKYNSSGSFLLSFYIAYTAFANASIIDMSGITVDSSGNIYMCGTLSPNPGGMGNIFYMGVFKFTSSGTLVWAMIAGTSTKSTQGLSVAIDSFNDVYACGVLFNSEFVLKIPNNTSSSYYNNQTLNSLSFIVQRADSSFTVSTPTISSSASSYAATTPTYTDAAGGVTDAQGELAQASIHLPG
jgi:hypothetical protein